MFWILAALLTLLVAAAVTRPLWLDLPEAEAEANGLDVYRRQLDELERDVEAGLVPESEAEATRTEIHRRMLSADRKASEQSRSANSFSKNQKIALTVAIGLVMPISALVLYLNYGAPGFPDRPYKDRCNALQEESIGAQDMGLLVDCLAVRMDANPQPEGLAMLGRSYMTLERYTEAARAFASAMEIGGANAEHLEGMGLSIVFANQGLVTDTAAEAFRQAIDIDGTSTIARYYLAEFDYQHGRTVEALNAWVDLLESTPQDSPFYADIDARIQAGLQEARGGDQTPQNDQSEMIAGMVEGLAARLQENPDDIDGWLMLIRSYAVLGRDADAHAAQSAATLHFMTDPKALEQIMALSGELGLSEGLAPPMSAE